MRPISPAHETASKLRMPVFARDTAAREKVDALEEYLLVSAYWQGECHEERLTAYRALADLQHEWDHLVGWESFRRTKTETAVEDAKRQLRPGLYDGIHAAKWQVARLTEEVERLERDATKASRVYTLVTGG